jgi:Phytoene/squalene synthetase
LVKNAILDDELHKDKMAQLFFFRKKLSTCYNELWSTDPVFLALTDSLAVFGFLSASFAAFISGVADDLSPKRSSTFDDLYLYCYKRASVVGMICKEIYGYDNP